MRLIRQLMIVLGLSFVAFTAHAAIGAPEAGMEYRVLNKPQQTDTAKKIEVIEFFAYFCPHCYAFEPHLAEWVKKQGDNIAFKRVHVDFHSLVTQQKLYYTLEALGRADDLHIKAFNAYHIERNRLSTDADIMAFVEKQGLDKQKFLGIYNSFSMQAKLSRGTQLQSAFGVDGVPTIAIDGRFVTSPSDVAKSVPPRSSEQVQFAETLKVMDWLVAKAQKEKK
jgi:thiol:disulfide interchange protein DsbA